MPQDPTHYPLLAIGVAVVLAAIRQADWKNRALIWSMLAIGAAVILVAIWPNLTGWAPLPNPAQAVPPWAILAPSVAIGGAFLILAVRRLVNGKGSARPDQFAADAVNAGAIYGLGVLVLSMVSGWPDDPGGLVAANRGLFVIMTVYAIVLVAETALRSIRAKRVTE